MIPYDTKKYGRIDGEITLPGSRGTTYLFFINALFDFDILEIIILLIGLIWLHCWIIKDLLFDREVGSYYSYKYKVCITKCTINDQQTVIESSFDDNQEIISTADFGMHDNLIPQDNILNNYEPPINNSKAVVVRNLEPLITYKYEIQVKFKLPNGRKLDSLIGVVRIDKKNLVLLNYSHFGVDENVPGDCVAIVHPFYEKDLCEACLVDLISQLYNLGCLVISKSINEMSGIVVSSDSIGD